MIPLKNCEQDYLEAFWDTKYLGSHRTLIQRKVVDYIICSQKKEILNVHIIYVYPYIELLFCTAA
jgi:hypothetical protein